MLNLLVATLSIAPFASWPALIDVVHYREGPRKALPLESIVSDFDADLFLPGKGLGAPRSPSFSRWFYVSLVDDELGDFSCSPVAFQQYKELLTAVDVPEAHSALRGETPDFASCDIGVACAVSVVLDYRAYLSQCDSLATKFQSFKEAKNWFSRLAAKERAEHLTTSPIMVTLANLCSISLEDKVDRRISSEELELLRLPPHPTCLKLSMWRRMSDDFLSRGNDGKAREYLLKIAVSADYKDWFARFLSGNPVLADLNVQKTQDELRISRFW